MRRQPGGEREELRACLEGARASMRQLTDGLDDATARAVFDPALSPIAWHVGHVAWQEERWALRRCGGQPPIDPALDGVYDSFHSPKGSRSRALPPIEEVRAYARQVRARTWELLGEPLDDERRWTFRFLANHEHQHVETVVAALLAGEVPLELAPRPMPAGGDGGGWDDFLPVEGGVAAIGTDDDPDRWDNESPAHQVEVAPFAIARRPITNQAVVAFCEAGGYDDERLWSTSGWRWRQQADVRAPLHWRPRGAGWQRRTLAGWIDLRPDHPAAHLSCYEAEAIAAWAGARLPTEIEWEVAAGRRPWPCGSGLRANLGLRLGDTAPCSAEGAAPCGAEDMAGNVWEWTASPFLPWPAFLPGPYRGYSLPWFGPGHRVLRGGCWATAAAVARTTFRNFFEPGMRLYPTGLRLARDQR